MIAYEGRSKRAAFAYVRNQDARVRALEIDSYRFPYPSQSVHYLRCVVPDASSPINIAEKSA